MKQRHSNDKELEEFLTVGIIQTNVDYEMAWENPELSLNMNRNAQEKAWFDIKKGFCNLNNVYHRPQIIVLPELTVPHGYVEDLKILSKAVGAVVIAGVDFEEQTERKVRNKAVITIPENWPDINTSDIKKSKRASSVFFGKTFFSNDEEEFFRHFKPPFEKFPDPVSYILDAGKFGEIGVAICSDFFDIERFVIYRGRIHHMIVISYNQDVNSYYFLAEAISRLVYCNVVICNTGHYGDSLVFSPYKESHRRIIYRHEGKNLFTTQIVKLPVSDLDSAQRREDTKKLFKSPPPGYQKS